MGDTDGFGFADDDLDDLLAPLSPEQQQTVESQAENQEFDDLLNQLMDDGHNTPAESANIRATPQTIAGTPDGSGIDTLVHDGDLSDSPTPNRPLKRRKKRKEAPAKPPEPEEDLVKRLDDTLKTLRPRKGLVIRDQDAHAYVEAFIKKMVQAAEEDVQLFSEGKPMVKKLNMLVEAVEVMEKYQFGDVFVTYNGCRALALWLTNLPNGELPSVHIRTALLRVMERLPITKDNLLSCGDLPLGKVIAGLQQSPKETVTNRKLCQQLVQKWLKQVLTPETSLDLDNFLADKEEKKGMIPRPEPLTEESLQRQEAESALRVHPSIPVVEGREYVVQPQVVDMPQRRDRISLDTFRGKLGEVLKVMSRPNKKAWKPWSVSIAGRQVNAD